MNGVGVDAVGVLDHENNGRWRRPARRASAKAVNPFSVGGEKRRNNVAILKSDALDRDDLRDVEAASE